MRGGRLVAEWPRGVDPAERLRLASATKSAFATVLGVAVEEGMHPSADARLADLFPGALDVLPGEVKHYRTFGTNVLAHALAATDGAYDVADPGGSPGFHPPVDTRLRIPLRGSWGYYNNSFEHPEGARPGHFGYVPGVTATARDMTRLGWLWCRYGRWAGEQPVPGRGCARRRRSSPPR